MYMAPEQYNEKPYGFKTDMWSFGCVAYEACTGNFAFQAQNINALARKVKRAEYPPIPSRYSKELRQLIGLMLSKSPKLRPTCAEVLQRPELRAHAQAWLSKLVHKVRTFTCPPFICHPPPFICPPPSPSLPPQSSPHTPFPFPFRSHLYSKT
jgi:serine/threonine protein kinase